MYTDTYIYYTLTRLASWTDLSSLASFVMVAILQKHNKTYMTMMRISLAAQLSCMCSHLRSVSPGLAWHVVDSLEEQYLNLKSLPPDVYVSSVRALVILDVR